MQTRRIRRAAVLAAGVVLLIGVWVVDRREGSGGMHASRSMTQPREGSATWPPPATARRLPFEKGRLIPLDVADRGLTVRSITWTGTEEQDAVSATLAVSYVSGPKRRWTIGLAIFDAKGACTFRAHQSIENSGIILGQAFLHMEELAWPGISPAAATCAAEFEVSVAGSNGAGDRGTQWDRR